MIGCKGRYASGLLDHLVGECEQLGRNIEAERPGGRQIDHEVILGGLLDRQVFGFGAAQDLVDIVGRPSEQDEEVRSACSARRP